MGNPDSTEVMRRYLFDVLRDGKLDVIDEIADENVVDHLAETVGWPAGRAGLRQHARSFTESLTDIGIQIHRLVSEDVQVCAYWTATGLHSGPMLGIPATGKHISASGVSFFQLKDGKIVDYLSVMDRWPTLKQLGAI